MSRHTFAGRAGETVAIGWDRPLRTFFVQVSVPHPTMAGGDKVLDWAGTEVGELTTAAEAMDIARTYADLPDTLGATLETDRLKTVATPDGPAGQLPGLGCRKAGRSPVLRRRLAACDDP